MANKKLFSTQRERFGRQGPAADTVNEAGGVAYSFTDKHALAQIVSTSCMNGSFYADAQAQLDQILVYVEKVAKVDPDFVAKVAVYGRKLAHMKDTPVALLAWMISNGYGENVDKVFNQVVDNGKMLRNFVQMMRSGRFGRKNIGSRGKRLIRAWLADKNDDYLFRASVGNQPSLADVIKMVHPKPGTASRKALYGYLLGKKYDKRYLPKIVKEYEAFKAGKSDDVPNVEFRLLTSLPLKEEHWKKIAENARWQMTRMNLNTFARHGVLGDAKMSRMIASRLSNREEVLKSKCFPYQLFTAYQSIGSDIPYEIRDALQEALEISVDNVLAFGGKVWIFPDVSGSMGSRVTGDVRSTTTCKDVAALFTAAVLRRNPRSEVLPFADELYQSIGLNGRDSIMTNAEKMSRLPGGGTDCSLPLAELNRRGEKADLLIYVSDNESWMNSGRYRWGRQDTGTQAEWEKFKKRNPGAKMVCIDIQATASSQVQEDKAVLNVGGFSDVVFDVIANFAEYGHDAAHWVEMIENSIDL